MAIWFHFATALLALALGGSNLILAKGTRRHRIVGWTWIVVMLAVSLSSFGIQEINPGGFSWIHGLTVWVLLCMGIAIVAIRRRRTRLHARCMVGTMVGAVVAGVFALAPGRHIASLIGY